EEAREALLRELAGREEEKDKDERLDDGPRRPSDADREKLQEMMRRGNELARELGGAGGRFTCAPEEPTEDKLAELAERTRVLCGLLGRGELSADLAPLKAQLEQVAEKLRATLLKTTVLDAAQPLDIRLVAFVGITDRAYYDALTLEQVGELLHDKSLHLKQQAAYFCGKAGLKQAVPHLLAAIKETPTDLEQPQWYYGFEGRLCGSGFFVKLDIFEALGELKAHDAVPALIDCFKEPPIEGKNMRSWIADALVRLVSKETASQYEELLKDPAMDEESRKKLSAALEKVK
ncbi:MAG: hypothetical protein RDV41_13695, partial [Planctomycetota bacterium]|nr:hypothetical protein [Planctomycetota bacterium]